MRNRGFTIVELMVGLVVVAIMLVIAVPQYAQFMDNTRVRNVTESLAGGVRQAQLEAVKRNEPVKFALTDEGWEVRDVETDGLLVAEAIFETTGKTAPAVEAEPSGATEVTFSGLGRALVKNPSDGTDPVNRIKVAPAGPGTKRLGVAVSIPGGNIKVCDPDPKFTYSGSKDPVACPHPW